MRAIRRVVYWTIAFALVFGTFWFAYARKPVETPVVRRPVPVEVEPVAIGAIENAVEITGRVIANRRVEVASKVAGRLESLAVIGSDGRQRPVEAGVPVSQGEALAVIDRDVHGAKVAAAEAEVRAQEVRLAEAERERKRIVRLFESGSATEQARDRAITEAELVAAGLNLAKAKFELAQINLRESTITAPIDGIVTEKYIDEGNLISPGQRIVSLADIRTVRVLVPVSERYGPQVCEGMPVRIVFDALPDRVFESEVYSRHPAVDERTHTMQVEARLSNKNLQLRPGMFARVRLVLGCRDQVLVVPRDVVLGGKIDEPYVYVVEGGTASKRPVRVGLTQDERVEIVEGLQAGESLVVNGMHYLADGAAVEVVRLEDIR